MSQPPPNAPYSQPPPDVPQTEPLPGQPVAQAPQVAPTQISYSTEKMLADKAAQMSVIFGIIGILFAGIIFGPLALWQAKKAEDLNMSATTGKILGWIALIIGVLWIVGIIFWIVVFMAAVGSSF